MKNGNRLKINLHQHQQIMIIAVHSDSVLRCARPEFVMNGRFEGLKENKK